MGRIDELQRGTDLDQIAEPSSEFRQKLAASLESSIAVLRSAGVDDLSQRPEDMADDEVARALAVTQVRVHTFGVAALGIVRANGLRAPLVEARYGYPTD